LEHGSNELRLYQSIFFKQQFFKTPKLNTNFLKARLKDVLKNTQNTSMLNAPFTAYSETTKNEFNKLNPR